MDLRLTRDMLTNKENEFNQIKLRFDETENNLQEYKERLLQNERITNDFKKQIEQYEQQVLELNQTRLKDVQVI